MNKFILVFSVLLLPLVAWSESEVRSLLPDQTYFGYVVSSAASPYEYREAKLIIKEDHVEILIADKAGAARLELPITAAHIFKNEYGGHQKTMLDAVLWNSHLTVQLDQTEVDSHQIMIQVKTEELLAQESEGMPPDMMPPLHRVLIEGRLKGADFASWQGALYSEAQIKEGAMEIARTMMAKNGTVLTPLDGCSEVLKDDQ